MILVLHGLVRHLQKIHPKFLEREKLEQDPKCMKNKDKKYFFLLERKIDKF